MIVIPGPIPLVIHPFFWLFAALLGWLNSGSLIGMFIWIGVIFLSVLFHEFGHAIMAILFKQKAQIQLVALGGLTTFNGPQLRFWKQFLITLNGPLFGFLLFILATAVLHFHPFQNPVLLYLFRITQLANLLWTVVNLFPVLPLDGGQLVRIFLEANFGMKGFKFSLLLGAIFASLLSFYFFIVQNFLAGAFFFLFAFQNFDSWRKSRFITRDDREETNKALLLQAERALQEGRRGEAKRLLEEIQEKATGGLLAFTASQYLALILFQEGKKQQAYELLLPIREQMSEEALCLLHQLAAEQKNYPLVAELSASCFQVAPSQQMALNNARAFAHLKEAKPAGGWLQTAGQYGGLDINAILDEEEFRQLKEDREFREFVDGLR